MNKSMLIAHIAVCFWIMAVGSVFAESQEGNQEPAELKKLRDSYKRQVEQTVNPIRSQYITQLERLKKTYTSQDNLKDAIAVQTELEKLRDGSDKADISVSGNIRIKARIDGSDKLILKDNKLWFWHVNCDRPKDISIDGKKWNPAWNGNESRHCETLFQPLSKATVKVKKLKGRGSVAIAEYPTDENEKTLVIAIDDKENGADEYEFVVSW